MVKVGVKNIIPSARIDRVKSSVYNIVVGSPIGPGFFLFLTYASPSSSSQLSDLLARGKISSNTPRGNVKNI